MKKNVWTIILVLIGVILLVGIGWGIMMLGG